MYNYNNRKMIVLMVGIILAFIIGGVYIYRESHLRSVKVFSDVNGTVLKTLIHSYATNGFTEDEVSTLVKFVSRSVAQMMFPKFNVRLIEIGESRTDGSAFEAYNIQVLLDGASVFIDNIVYDGNKLSLQFSVSRKSDNGFFRCVPGDLCIVYWEDGRWYRR